MDDGRYRDPRSGRSGRESSYGDYGAGRNRSSVPRTGTPRGVSGRREVDRARLARLEERRGARRPYTASQPVNIPRRKDPVLEERRQQEYEKIIDLKNETTKKVFQICGIALAVLFILMLITSGGKKKVDPPADNASTEAPVEQTQAPDDSGVPSVSVNLCAVGDNYVQKGVYQAGHQEDDTYNYTGLYENVKYLMEDCDIKAVSQDTIFAGDDKGIQAEPIFNAPVGIADSLANAGFNMIAHASDHAFDMGAEGIDYTISNWREKHPDITVLGINSSESQSNIEIQEIKGIKIALLNYTATPKWETIPEGAEGRVNMLFSYNAETKAIDPSYINEAVLDDIKNAEAQADFTVVFVHWGREYNMTKTQQQEVFAKAMTEEGADLIIGSHPHVLEPVEWITSDNGNKSLCYYSLGNFMSTQDELERILGAMAKLTITKKGDKVYIEPESVKAIPLVTHYVYPGWTGQTVATATYPLGTYTDELATAHGLKPRCGIAVTRNGLESLAREILGEYYSAQ